MLPYESTSPRLRTYNVEILSSARPIDSEIGEVTYHLGCLTNDGDKMHAVAPGSIAPSLKNVAARGTKLSLVGERKSCCVCGDESVLLVIEVKCFKVFNEPQTVKRSRVGPVQTGAADLPV